MEFEELVMERECGPTRTCAAEIISTGRGYPFNGAAFTKKPQCGYAGISRDGKGLDDLTADEVYFASTEMRRAA